MKTFSQTTLTRCFFAAVVVAGLSGFASTAQAQLRGVGNFGGFDIPRRTGSSSSTLEYVLPQVIRTVETLRDAREQNRYQPAPNPPRQCPVPAPSPVVIPAPPPAAVVDVPDVAETKVSLARTLVERAKQSFANQDYKRTAETLTEVLELVPEDGDAYQFRSLAYFALQDHERAAADAYESFRFGNAWTWATMATLYPKGQSSRYTDQLRKLEQTNRSDERSMTTHFLLAYHYIVLGHLQHAERELTRVLEVNTEEPLSKQLLAVVQDAQQKS
jgi:tetratricopeptide (TPR) repeat protein